MVQICLILLTLFSSFFSWVDLINALSCMDLLGCCRYERFIVAIEEASRDMLPILKDKALKVGGLVVSCTVQFLVYTHISTHFC